VGGTDQRVPGGQNLRGFGIRGLHAACQLSSPLGIGDEGLADHLFCFLALITFADRHPAQGLVTLPHGAVTLPHSLPLEKKG
jgi:hypothetical protein